MISRLVSGPIVDIVTAEVATMRSCKEPTDPTSTSGHENGFLPNWAARVS